MSNRRLSKRDLRKQLQLNNERSKEVWKQMKAASSKEKNPIGTRVSVRALSTNMKNQ